MEKRYYNLTDLQSGEVKKKLTHTQLMDIVGRKIEISRYCNGKIYKKRWKIELCDGSPEFGEASRPADAKFRKEWKEACARLKGVPGLDKIVLVPNK